MQAHDNSIAAEKEKTAIKVVRRFKNFVGREKKDKGAFRPFCFRAAEDVGKNGTEGLPVRAAEPVRMGRIGVEGFFDFRRDMDGHIDFWELKYAMNWKHFLNGRKNLAFVFAC